MNERHIFWLIVVVWGAALFGILVGTRMLTPYVDIGDGFHLLEQALYAMVLAPYPAFLVFCLVRRSQRTLSFQRLVISGAAAGFLIFAVQIALFVLFELEIELVLPPDSNLYDTKLLSQVTTFSRVPMMSHYIAYLLFVGAFSNRMVKPGEDVTPQLIKGLTFYIVYLVGFFFCHMWWQYLLNETVFPPNKVNLVMLFVHWLPTAYFLALTYLYSVKQKE